MDLATLALAVAVAFGLITTDAVMRSGSISIEVEAPSNVFRDTISKQNVEKIFTGQLDLVATTPSMVNPPQIRSSREDGIGMTLASELKLKSIAYTIQNLIGIESDCLDFLLLIEGGKLRGVVSGHSAASGRFTQTFTAEPDETLVNFVERSANWGAAKVAPYNTALFLLEHHVADGDFRDVTALCEHAIAALPPAPVNATRGQYLNLLGLVDLFRNDLKAARANFEAAARAWPTGAVPVLNVAFTDLALDDNATAVAMLRKLLEEAPNAQQAVIGTAHMTLAAALIASHDYDGAEQELTTAVAVNPTSSAAPDLWADLKELRGDQAAAVRLRTQALQNSTGFENFGELAALYFALNWRDNEAITRARFGNPGVMVFH